jgi:hypothetical protein
MKLSHSGRIQLSLLPIVVAVICWQPCLSSTIQQSGADQVASATPGLSSPNLQIVVLEGEDGVNVIKKKTAVKPVVQVRDKNKGPGAAVIGGGVAGAVVLFVLPEKGASGTFPNGWRWAQVTTDADGRAVAPEIRPNGKGSFKIEIRASYLGTTVIRSITQTNFSTIAEAQKAGKTPGNSTHDNLENESSQQAQNAGQSGTQSTSSGASSSPAAPAASAGAAAGGHTALITGLAIAGAAAASAGAYVASRQSSSHDCTAQSNQLQTDANNTTQVCGVSDLCTLSTPLPAQCFQSAQQLLNDAGALCQCAGSAVASQVGTLVPQLCVSQLGLTWPAQCH